MITHSIYASIVPVAIALAIVFTLFVVATIFEQRIIRFEDRQWKHIKRGIRRAMLKSRRIREWAGREDPKGSRVILPNHPNCPHTFIPWYGDEPDDDYKVDDKIYRVRR